MYWVKAILIRQSPNQLCSECNPDRSYCPRKFSSIDIVIIDRKSKIGCAFIEIKFWSLEIPNFYSESPVATGTVPLNDASVSCEVVQLLAVNRMPTRLLMTGLNINFTLSPWGREHKSTSGLWSSLGNGFIEGYSAISYYVGLRTIDMVIGKNCCCPRMSAHRLNNGSQTEWWLYRWNSH